MPLAIPQTTRDQDIENPLAIADDGTKGKPIVVYLPTDGSWSAYSKDRPDTTRGLTFKAQARVITLNNGDQYLVVIDDASGKPIGTTTLGEKWDTEPEQAKKYAAEKKERQVAKDKEEAIRRTEENQAERKITKVEIVKENGQYIKRTTYESGSPKDEVVNPETSISTVEIGGKRFLIQTQKNPDGTFTPPSYTDLSTGQSVATLPVAPDRANQPTTHFTKGGDGKTYAVTVGPDGKLIGAKDTGIPAEAKNTDHTVEYPDGTKHIIRIGADGRATEVFATPAAPAPPAESGSFIPDPRKPAMGLGDYVQNLANLRAAGKINDKQYEDLKATAYNIALSEAKRLDTIVSAQRSATQDQITQRSNDLQAAQGRLTYSGQATQNAYDTAIKIAQGVNPKYMASRPGGGGNILASIMSVQDMRAKESGGYFQPPTITPSPESAYGQVQTWGTNAGMAPGVAPVTPPPTPPKPSGPVGPVSPGVDNQSATRPPVAPPAAARPSVPPTAAQTNPPSGDAQVGTQTVAPAPSGAVVPDGGESRGTPPSEYPPHSGIVPQPAPPGEIVPPVTPEGTIPGTEGTVPVGPEDIRIPMPGVVPGTEGTTRVGPEDINVPFPENVGPIPPEGTEPLLDEQFTEPMVEYEDMATGQTKTMTRAEWDQLTPFDQKVRYKKKRDIQPAQPQTPKPQPEHVIPDNVTTPSPQVSGAAQSVDPNWLTSTETSPKPVAEPFSWFTPNNNAAANQPWPDWMRQEAITKAYDEQGAAYERNRPMGSARVSPGQWFTPSGQSPSGPIGMTPPIGPVATMNPRVNAAMQKYANDPEMLEAIMQAQGMG